MSDTPTKSPKLQRGARIRVTRPGLFEGVMGNLVSEQAASQAAGDHAQRSGSSSPGGARGARRAQERCAPVYVRDDRETHHGSKVTPNLRRAFHQALDLVLDALAEEERGAPKKRRRPSVARALPPLPEGLSEEKIAEIEARWERAGWKRAG